MAAINPNTAAPTTIAASYNAANTAAPSSDSTPTQKTSKPTLSIDPPVHSNPLTGKATGTTTPPTSGTGTTGTKTPPTLGTGTTGSGSGTGTTSSTSTVALISDAAQLERQKEQEAEEKLIAITSKMVDQRTLLVNPRIKREGTYNIAV